MKCLSLWQPWASLLVHGPKRVETRGWAMSHRGGLLIHAAKTWNPDIGAVCAQPVFRDALRQIAVELVADEGACKRAWGLPLGVIVGRVEVVECYPTADVDFDYSGLDVTPNDPVWQYAAGKLRLWHEEKAFGDYGPNRFAFLCRNPVAFAEPIPFRGMQGLFDVRDDLIPAA